MSLDQEQKLWRDTEQFRTSKEHARIADVLHRAAGHGFRGFGGACGHAALAINHQLLGGKGKYVGAFNKHLWKNHGRAVGHIAVAHGGHLYDAKGVWVNGAKHLPGKVPEDMESWGMLPNDDPDYDLPDDDAADDVAVVRLSGKRLKEMCSISTGEEHHPAITRAIESSGAHESRADQCITARLAEGGGSG